MTAPAPAPEAPAARKGRRAFLQGKIPGATSAKGRIRQNLAIFGGVAPAPPTVELRLATRPERIRKWLCISPLTPCQVSRICPITVPISTNRCPKLTISPGQRRGRAAVGRFRPRRTPPTARRERGG